jgi:integrase
VEDLPRRVALEATDDFTPGLALLDAALVVVLSARVDPQAGEHDAVERGVGLSVPAAVEATELPASRGTLDRTDPAQGGEGRLTVQALYAIREDELPRNVARNVQTTTVRPRRFRPLTAAEARQFLDAARADPLHALYELALRTGLRKGELLGLHWEDLDLNAGTATIRHSLQRTRTGGLTQLPTKTRASERRVALPTECLHSLKEHQERQERERKEAGVGWRDSGLAFTTPTGRPLDPANLTRRFRSLLNRAGLRRIRFHDLRHSTATLLLEEQGVDLVVIKELLSHANIGVTAGVYAHVRLRLQRQAIDTLGSALDQTDDGPDDPPAAAVVR